MAVYSPTAKLEWNTRLCKVKGELGYFQTWELYSQPLEASPLIGGAPAGIFSRVYGIVEFPDGVRRVNPVNIEFCDENHADICAMNKYEAERKKNEE